MKDQLGIAVLGCGYWGMNYVRIFNELPESRVVAVCDADPSRLEAIGQRYPGVILTTDVRHALSLSSVDAVVICTPATTHHDVALAAFAAGKHALIEKPLATTTQHAEAIRSAAELHGLTLLVGHTFIYNPGIRTVRECIESDKVGRVYYLYAARTNLGPVRHDVNAIWDLASHDVAIFNYLLDSSPDWAMAAGVKVLNNCREDAAFITLGYPNGVVGNIHVSWADPNKVREVVVVGSNARVAFNDLNALEQVRIFEKSISPMTEEASNYGEFQFQVRDGNVLSPRIEVSEPLKNQARHFIDCAKTGKQPDTDGSAGREVVRVMEAIDRSIRRNGSRVQLGSLSNGAPVVPLQELAGTERVSRPTVVDVSQRKPRVHGSEKHADDVLRAVR